MNLVERREATEQTVTRYRGKTFDWKTGVTCVRLARDHLRGMGHSPPTLPHFRSLLGAKKALAAKGWEGPAEMLDALLVRIAPARMLPGDLTVLPGEGMDAIFVNLGFGRMFGWWGDIAEPVMLSVDLAEVKGAWRA